MHTIVSLLAVVVVVPFGGNSVQAGYPGPGCPDADEAAIEEKTFCNSFSVSSTGQPRVCPGPTPGFGYTCDRSNGDNSGGTWYVERLPQSHTLLFFFFLPSNTSLVRVGCRSFLFAPNRLFFSLFHFSFSRVVAALPPDLTKSSSEEFTKATTEDGSQDDADVVAVKTASSSPPTTVVPVGLVVAATVAVLGTVALL